MTEAIRTLQINIPGIPRPQPRARHVPAGKGRVRVVSTVDDHAQLWREHVDKRVREALKAVGASWLPQKGEAMEARMIFRMPSKDERELVRRELDLDALEIQADGNSQGGGLGVGLVIELRVVAVGSYHVKVPDADNLAKLAMDVLKKGGALGELDDCALARIEVLKLRA